MRERFGSRQIENSKANRPDQTRPDKKRRKKAKESAKRIPVAVFTSLPFGFGSNCFLFCVCERERERGRKNGAIIEPIIKSKP